MESKGLLMCLSKVTILKICKPDQRSPKSSSNLPHYGNTVSILSILSWLAYVEWAFLHVTLK